MRPRQIAAMSGELTSATSLLGRGINILVADNWSPDESAPMLTCLASGAERVMKLGCVMALEADGKEWGPDDLKTLGHNLATLRMSMDGNVQTNLSRATHPNYIKGLVQDTQDDPYLDLVFTAMDRWAAASGRYRDFNILGGDLPINDDPAHALWGEAESKVATDLGLFVKLGDPSHQMAALLTIRETLAGSLVKWWFLQHRVWSHGVLGDNAKVWSSGLDPRNCRAIADYARLALKGR